MRAATGEPEPEPEAARVCFVCSGGSDAEKGEVIKNCRCRGDAGFVHLSCLARAVRVVGVHRKGRWESCPSCGHRWSGAVGLHLARCRHDIAKATRDEDELLLATLQLTAALKENGEYAEALRLGREALGECTPSFVENGRKYAVVSPFKDDGRVTLHDVTDPRIVLAKVAGMEEEPQAKPLSRREPRHTAENPLELNGTTVRVTRWLDVKSQCKTTITFSTRAALSTSLTRKASPFVCRRGAAVGRRRREQEVLLRAALPDLRQGHGDGRRRLRQRAGADRQQGRGGGLRRAGVHVRGTARGAEGDDAAPAGELPRACAGLRGRGQEEPVLREPTLAMKSPCISLSSAPVNRVSGEISEQRGPGGQIG